MKIVNTPIKIENVGVWNTIPDLETLNMLVGSLDFVYVDLEHGFRDIQTITNSILLLNALGSEYSIRVRKYNDPIIQTLADFGVKDIIVPGLRTKKEFEDFKSRINSSPGGILGVHPRSEFTGKSRSQSKISITVIIETKESIDLIDYFANDPQVKTIYLGSFDLAQELEISEGPFSAKLDTYFQRISQACLVNNKFFAAMLPTDMLVNDFGAKGVNKILIGIDLLLLHRSVFLHKAKNPNRI